MDDDTELLSIGAHAATATRGTSAAPTTPAHSSQVAFRSRFPLRQFAVETIAMLEAGFGLVEALEALEAKERQRHTRDVLAGVLGRLREGQSPSMALRAFPGAFPPLLVATVRASEYTGDIAEVLRRYVEYLDQVDTVRNQVISASVYPLILLAAGFLVTGFLMGYVVPRLAGAYHDIGRDAPWLSRVLFDWGAFAKAHTTSVFAGAVLVFTLTVEAALRPRTWSMIHRTVSRVPAVGRRLDAYHLARLYRTLGMLLNGGIALPAALDMASGILPAHLAPALQTARTSIVEGMLPSRALEAAGLTTAVATRMLRLGERAGRLDTIMVHIARFHDGELAIWLERSIRIIEPALMVLMGVLVGGIVLLMYLPIFELTGGVG